MTALPYALPAGVIYDDVAHRYATADGRPLLSVTGALRAAGLDDHVAYCTDADRQRGRDVADAIARHHRTTTNGHGDSTPLVALPYVRAYIRFLQESGFRVQAVEEVVWDPQLQVAGRLDLRGQFPADTPGVDRVDVIDVKTGGVPASVGWQVAGYVRLLPRDLPGRRRRWCLQLRADESYRLLPLHKRSDEVVFLAAVTIAQAKRGWL